tara:strand:+ start:199 stop:903 length:705 start_codon:yes stop_codon:yes gene_type:complete
MKSKNFVLICARRGSKGIKNKNLQKVGKLSLVEHSIKIAKKIKNNFVIISSDSKKIINVSRKYKLNFYINRPKTLSLDSSAEINVWKHSIKILKKQLNFIPEFIIVLPPTSPLREINDINRCLVKYKNRKFDMIIMGYKSNHNPYFNMVIRKKNYFKIAINNKKKYFRRQDAPEIFNISTACYIINVNYLMKKNNIYDGKIGLVEIPIERSIDIDTTLDLKLANLIYNGSKKRI